MLSGTLNSAYWRLSITTNGLGFHWNAYCLPRRKWESRLDPYLIRRFAEDITPIEVLIWALKSVKAMGKNIRAARVNYDKMLMSEAIYSLWLCPIIWRKWSKHSRTRSHFLDSIVCFDEVSKLKCREEEDKPPAANGERCGVWLVPSALPTS